MRLEKTFCFEAAHWLPNVPEGHKCKRMHGHSFRVTVVVEGNVDPEAGWVMDYGVISKAFAPLDAQLDHYLLNEIEGFKTNIPEGAFYVFPDISFYFGKTFRGKTIHNATDFSMYLLEEALVATVTGDAFGNRDCIRISYAASQEQLIEAIKRIKNSLS